MNNAHGTITKKWLECYQAYTNAPKYLTNAAV